jgi:hypothetical protein
VKLNIPNKSLETVTEGENAKKNKFILKFKFLLILLTLLFSSNLSAIANIQEPPGKINFQRIKDRFENDLAEEFLPEDISYNAGDDDEFVERNNLSIVMFCFDGTSLTSKKAKITFFKHTFLNGPLVNEFTKYWIYAASSLNTEIAFKKTNYANDYYGPNYPIVISNVTSSWGTVTATTKEIELKIEKGALNSGADDLLLMKHKKTIRKSNKETKNLISEESERLYCHSKV